MDQLAVFMWCVYAILIGIVLVNLLIAIMNDTYDRIKETEVRFGGGATRLHACHCPALGWLAHKIPACCLEANCPSCRRRLCLCAAVPPVPRRRWRCCTTARA